MYLAGKGIVNGTVASTFSVGAKKMRTDFIYLLIRALKPSRYKELKEEV